MKSMSNYVILKRNTRTGMDEVIGTIRTSSIMEARMKATATYLSEMDFTQEQLVVVSETGYKSTINRFGGK